VKYTLIATEIATHRHSTYLFSRQQAAFRSRHAEEGMEKSLTSTTISLLIGILTTRLGPSRHLNRYRSVNLCRIARKQSFS